MTELQKRYTEARVNKRLGHHAALRELAGQTGIDPASIDRALKRAAREDERDGRKS